MSATNHTNDTACSCETMRMFGSVVVGRKWQIVIPKDVRQLLSIEPGDSLVVITKYDKAIGLIKSDDLPALMEYMQQEMEASANVHMKN